MYTYVANSHLQVGRHIRKSAPFGPTAHRSTQGPTSTSTTPTSGRGGFECNRANLNSCHVAMVMVDNAA